jgi:hypothetical protein
VKSNELDLDDPACVHNESQQTKPTQDSPFAPTYSDVGLELSFPADPMNLDKEHDLTARLTESVIGLNEPLIA